MSKKTYAYTTGTLGTVQSTETRAYGNSNWLDQLTNINGTAITYDNMGNPLKWHNASSLTWEGRKLKTFTKTDGTVISYTYDENGIRTGKKIGSENVEYVLSGTNIVQEKRANYTLTFLYDGSTLIGFNYKAGSTNADYYYGIDNFGNINYIYDSNGSVVVTYKYDAWGKLISTTGSLASTIGVINPYRYKSYYFDTETNLYYLQSRYYDAGVQRFVSPDQIEYLGGSGEIYSCNLYSYCENDPVNYIDPTGYEKTYSGIVGFGMQFLLTASIFGIQAFVGFEALWFAFTGNNNFGNGIIPWCYWFHGASVGLTVDLKKFLNTEVLTNPKKMLSAMGFGFGVTFSFTIFIITANNMKDPSDYEGGFSFWTGTVWGVTVSKEWGTKITTYGVGFSYELTISRPWFSKKKISVGKKLFGATNGSSWYIAVPLGSNAVAFYDYVRNHA